VLVWHSELITCDFITANCKFTTFPLIYGSSCHTTGLFATVGFDEPHAFAVGAGRVRPGAFGCQTLSLTGLAPRLEAVSTAIVREHHAARDSLAANPGQGSDRKACCEDYFSLGKTSA